MTKALVYPKADSQTQWWESDFDRGTFTAIEKLLLHTTETTGWPGYKSGASAPTLTYHCRKRLWRQHNKMNRSARALLDPSESAVRENRDNVVQIEIIAYADEKVAASVGGLPVSKLTEDNLKDLGLFLAWLRKEWGGPPLVAAKMSPYPESYGDNPNRLSGPEYDAFKGILGHSNAPANDSWGNRHGDPGALNVERILYYAKQAETPTTTTTAPKPTTETSMALTNDDVKKIWRGDIIPAPAGSPATNPTWQPDSYLRETYNRISELEGKVDEILTLLKKEPVDGN